MVIAATGWSGSTSLPDYCGLPTTTEYAVGPSDRCYSENITIRHMHLQSVQGALTFDTCWNGGLGTVRDVTIYNITIGSLVEKSPHDDCIMRMFPYDSAYSCPWPVTGQGIHFRSRNPAAGAFTNISKFHLIKYLIE